VPTSVLPAVVLEHFQAEDPGSLAIIPQNGYPLHTRFAGRLAR
jgi:hypothetical protein